MYEDIQDLKEDYIFPASEHAPITRTMLALYAGASGDHNPIHIDIDFAKKAGLNDVIAHGMLIMSMASKSLTDIFSHEHIKEIDVKFVSITRIGDRPIFNASVLRKKIHKNKRLLDLKITISDQNGDIKLDGTAKIELSDES